MVNEDAIIEKGVLLDSQTAALLSKGYEKAMNIDTSLESMNTSIEVFFYFNGRLNAHLPIHTY